MASLELSSLVEEGGQPEKNDDWALKELDSGGSCMQLGGGTQCVNEVNSVLDTLKQQLLIWRDKERRRMLHKFEKLSTQSVSLADDTNLKHLDGT